MLVCVPALFAPLTVIFSVPAGQVTDPPPNADAPAAVRQHRGGVSLVVNHHRQRRACGKAGAAAGDHLRLSVFDDIDHIITRDGIHPQARQTGIDGDIARAATGVANGVGHRGINR